MPGVDQPDPAPGEDVRQGAVIAEAGVSITGRVLGSLAAAGAATVTVRRRPVVAVAATGDELLAPGRSLARGQIFESNGAHLAATLTELGVQVRGPVVLSDDTQGFSTGLDQLADGAGELANGSSQLAGGADQLASGANSLGGGLDTIAAKAREAGAGATQLGQGLLGGAATLERDGIVPSELLDAANGAKEATAGVKRAANGAAAATADTETEQQ